MKIYTHIYVKIVENFLLAIFFIVFPMQAMESEGGPKVPAFPRNTVMQQKKIRFFDPAKLMNNGIKWNDAAPKKMLIAPNKQGAFVGTQGKVYYVNFGEFFGADPHLLIQHIDKTAMPMFDVVEKPDHQMLVSICNYKNEDNKRVAQCIISRNVINPNVAKNSHNLFTTTCENIVLNKPIQAMALTFDGTMLAMAQDSFIEVLNLATGKSMTSKFVLPIFERNETDTAIVDIAVKNCSGRVTIAAANSNGVINIKQMLFKQKSSSEEVKELTLSHIKEMVCGDKSIQKIGLIGDDCDLFYTLPDGTTKIIRAHDWVEISGTIMNAVVKNYIFCRNELCKKVAADQRYQCATIHWPKKREGLIMEVVRENDHMIEKFSLIANDDAQSTCNCIGKGGQDKTVPLYILVAALKDERAAAIFADGYLRFWTLPAKDQKPTEEDVARANDHVGMRKMAMLDVQRNNSVPVDQIKHKLVRERSSSLPVIEKKKSHKDKTKQDKEVDGEQKEKSFVFMSKASSATKVSPTTSRGKLDKKRKSDKGYREAMQKDTTNDFLSQRSQDQ